MSIAASVAIVINNGAFCKSYEYRYPLKPLS